MNLITINKNLQPKKKTILICDDDRDVLLFFEVALESEYDVILVTSGKDCIEKFVEEKNRGNKIHLILLDYKLGDMFGDSVARKIKELNGPRIILISALDLDHALVKELEDGDYITKHVEKPIQANQLIELVAEVTR